VIAMPRKPKKTDENRELKTKLGQCCGLLKFVLSTDDQELIKVTIESVIETLEEEINK
jgi:hypothetical protein